MRRPFAKFFADRGTHLAAMIAYFALLSFVPLLFLTLSLLGLTGRADESSYVVHELKRALPHTSVSSIVGAVQEIQDSATTLGIAGVVVLAWTSLSLFGVLESAFNIVYGRPNRSFLRGKSLALGFLSLVLMATFAGLLPRFTKAWPLATPTSNPTCTSTADAIPQAAKRRFWVRSVI